MTSTGKPATVDEDVLMKQLSRLRLATAKSEGRKISLGTYFSRKLEYQEGNYYVMGGMVEWPAWRAVLQRVEVLLVEDPADEVCLQQVAASTDLRFVPLHKTEVPWGLDLLEVAVVAYESRNEGIPGKVGERAIDLPTGVPRHGTGGRRRGRQ